MSSALVFTIFGATGQQGSSVIKHVSARFPGKFQFRGVTRQPNSDQAKKLLKQLPNASIQLVQADMNNRDQVSAAVKGAYAVFGMTNYWEPEILANHAKEIEQGKNLVDACVANGVKYFIWSSLPDTKTESKGKFEVTHFIGKAQIQEYANSQSKLKSILFIPPLFYQNLLPPGVAGMVCQQQSDGSWTIRIPVKSETPLPWYDVDDTGKIIAMILENPDKWAGKEISSEAELVTGEQLAAAFSKAKGKPVKFYSVSDEELKAVLPPFLYKEFTDMYGWFDEFGLYGKNSDLFPAKESLAAGELNSLENFFRSHDFSSQKQ